jgi:KaiC/GvpD/RAD55 family RecA-like ATPase
MFMKLSNLMAEVTKKDFFKEGEVEKATRNIEIEYNDLRATHLHDYMNMVAKFRFANDENYFLTFTDSLKRTTVSDMTRYVTDYFSDHTGIRCLYTSARAMRNAKPDQQYFPLDESVGDVRFNYELNKTDIEADTAKRDLQRLIQWLKINPDMHVQINGFADESEFKKSFDTIVMHFIDSTPSFRKAMPDAIKVRYLRIEMMRAMKIAKAIYEAGIPEDRIAGTSMVFTSDTDEKAVENRKCTVTLEKMRPRPSLYEYHFGKKKEEEKTNAR